MATPKGRAGGGAGWEEDRLNLGSREPLKIWTRFWSVRHVDAEVIAKWTSLWLW